MGKEKLIPFIAIAIIILGASANAYVYINQKDATSITINEQDYTINQLFSLTIPREFKELEFSGIALDALINKVGIAYPESKDYTIIGNDGYQKTVKWENLQNGLLTEDGMVVFSDLPKAFRVKNIVEIGVVLNE